MKKIILKILFLLSLICLGLCLTACEKFTSDPTETPYEIANETFSLELTEDGTGYRVLGFVDDLHKNQKAVTIPDYVSGKPVTEIAELAFYNCKKLMIISLPKTLKKIGDSAFSACSQITRITIPASVEKIGSNAFKGCVALTEIDVETDNKNYSSKDGVLYCNDGKTLLIFPISKPISDFSIPLGVEEVYDNAFYANKYIERLTIPESVIKVGFYAFKDMQKVKYISIPNSLQQLNNYVLPMTETLEYNEKDGGLYLGNPNNPYLYLVSLAEIKTDKFTIADTCKYVNDQVFTHQNVTELTVPKSVIWFGDDAFKGARVEKVLYGGTVNDWCDIKFSGTIHYLNMFEMEDYGGYSNPLSVGADLYVDGKVLTEITFPEGTKTINDAVFYGYRNLTKVVIPNSVTKIGTLAFAFCNNVKEFILPNGVTDIGAWAFMGCIGIQEISLPENLVTIGESAFSNCVNLNSIVIPDEVKTVGAKAFFNCNNLLEVVLGESVEQVGNFAFRFCERVINAISKSKQIVLKKQNNNCGSLSECATYVYNVGDAVTTQFTIDENGFVTVDNGEEKLLASYVGKQTEIIIPDGITSICEHAFYGNSNITTVTISNSVTQIQHKAFYNCPNLKKVVFGDSVEQVGNSAFFNNTALETVEFNEGLKEIGGLAFYQSGLTQLAVPNSVTKIGHYAFYNSLLKSVKFGSGVQTVDICTFAYCNNLEEVDLGSVQLILDEAFFGCYSLKEITVPDSVTNIGERVFSNCSNLKKVTLGKGISTIPKETFSGCSYLEEIIFSDNLENIGEYAFENCTALESISLTQNVKNLGDHAFDYCSSLTSVTLGANIVSLGYMTFNQCVNLTEVIYNGTMEKWTAVKVMGDYIFNFTAVTEVICSDGNVEVLY